MGQDQLGQKLQLPVQQHGYWESLKIMDSVLFCKFSRKDSAEEHIQLIVPRKLKDVIMYQMHESLLSGHLGKGGTRE